jgi:hypothetical protein
LRSFTARRFGWEREWIGCLDSTALGRSWSIVNIACSLLKNGSCTDYFLNFGSSESISNANDEEPVSGRLDPDGCPKTSVHQLFFQLRMLRSAIVLTCSRGARHSVSSAPFVQLLFNNRETALRGGVRGLCSTMTGPKYLTGDKAGIDEFIDQYDVICPLRSPKKEHG